MSALGRAVRQLDTLALASAGFLAVLVVALLLAPLIAGEAPGAVSIPDRLRPPVFMAGGSWDHPLGTDQLGRDMFARLLYGGRVSLIVGTAVVLLSGTVGTAAGLWAGFKGGVVDTIVSRLADAQLAFPGLLLVLTIVATFGSSLPTIIFVLSLYGWMMYARLVRSLVLDLRERPYIEASRVIGCSSWRLVVKHILPMLYAPLLTQAMLEFARVVLAEASLSYLGLGVQPPSTSWGLMVSESQSYIGLGWWTVVLPGVALALTVLAINLISSSLRLNADTRFAARGAGARRRESAMSTVGARQ